jgi:hypothetical protein
MGQNNEGSIPTGISLDDAYKSVRQFLTDNSKSIADDYNKSENEYQEANKSNADYMSGTTPYHKRLKELVDYLINNELQGDLEKRTVLIEVICGHLENFYHKDNGKYKMAAYADAVLRARPEYWLTEDEKQELLSTNEDLYEKVSSNNRLKQ